jgi:hypothetical protein
MAASVIMRRAIAGTAGIALLLGTYVATGTTGTLPDAPFVALAAGHVGTAYSDQVADVFQELNSGVSWDDFHLTDGSLHCGLHVDPHAGTISGTPSEAGIRDVRIAASARVFWPRFPFIARTSFLSPFISRGWGGIGIGPRLITAEVRAQVAILSQDEHEICPGQSFQQIGPYTVTERTTTFNWTSSFDGQTRPANVVIFTPVSNPIVWHPPFPWLQAAQLALTTLPPPPPPPPVTTTTVAATHTLATLHAAAAIDRAQLAATMPSPAIVTATRAQTLSTTALATAATAVAVAPTATLAARAVNPVLFWPRPCHQSRFPLIVHHRGRGFTETDYHDLLTRIASWGIVIASVSDSESFENPSAGGLADWNYDGVRAELGMENASAAQEATMNFVLGLAATPGDDLYGKIDPDNVFFEGHSRGGGATHASHVRSIPLRVKGVIYFMAYDLRNFANCAPPAVAPAYPIPTAQKRLPSLIIAAERDGDLSYPIADQFIDRATGPTTFVTVYGGCHDFLGDSNTYDIYGATIARQDEQVRVADFVVAFVRRWADNDLSLEGFLYGNDHATSSTVGIASWHRVSPTLMVDDFQDADPAHNLLGGDNAATGLSRVEESIYPQTGDMASLGLKHSIMTLNAQDSSFSMTLAPSGAGQCLQAYRSVVMRIEQTGSQGYNLGMWVRLTDTCGNTASVMFTKEDGSSLGYLPAWPAVGQTSLGRFLTLSVPLSRIQQANTCLDLGNVAKVELVVHTPNATPDPSQQVVVDDVRFE